ncbi:hypothetical protein MC885_021638, partial [Smutsia gigantea]
WEPLYNQQETKASLKELFAFLCNSELLSDGKGHSGAVASGGPQRIPGHCFVLAAGSTIFDAMFNGGMATVGRDQAALPVLLRLHPLNCQEWPACCRNLEAIQTNIIKNIPSHKVLTRLTEVWVAGDPQIHSQQKPLESLGGCKGQCRGKDSAGKLVFKFDF